ncbi:MAG: PLP-dependent aminotransferase family protein [bacterium]
MFLHLDGNGPRYRQVYAALRQAILRGELSGGERLPSSRALALSTGLSRITIQLAFEQLLAEGYVEARVGSGTYVCAGAEPTAFDSASDAAPPRPAAARRAPRLSALGRRLATVTPLLSGRGHGRPRPRYDFRHGLPALSDLPQARWRRLLGRQARRAEVTAYDYGPAAGALPLREAIAAYLRRARGLACEAAQIVIVNGSQQGVELCARLLLDPGDTALVEEPGYEGARSALRAAGAQIAALRVDADGIDIARASSTARRARLAYVTPAHQFPTGAVLSLPRRLALLDWARRRGALIVEDDYDGEFHYGGRPLAPLQGLDRDGRVIYLGTFSKVMFPALRLGYLVLPPPLARLFAHAKALADGGTSGLEQHALAQFIAGGSFERHLRRARVRNRERRGALLAAIERHLGDRVQVSGANAGLHVLLRLPAVSQARAELLIRRAAQHGVGVYSALPYYLRPPRDAALVLGYASLSPEEIEAGIALLAEVW